VKLKIANFAALNPDATTAGMSRGSRLDEQVFAGLWADPARLQAPPPPSAQISGPKMPPVLRPRTSTRR
jgi:hypothetical protein